MKDNEIRKEELQRMLLWLQERNAVPFIIASYVKQRWEEMDTEEVNIEKEI